MPRRPDDIRDEQLVLKCRRGDVPAWAELNGCYNERLFYYVRRMVDADEQAAQLLQEVWGNVLQSLRSLRQGCRFAQMVWGFTVLMVTFFLMLGMSLPDRQLGILLILQSVVFLIGAAVYWLNQRIEESELNLKEKLLEIELQLAEMTRLR